MGQTLSEPITTKESCKGENKRLIFGASSMQGWRATMEDAHTVLIDVPGIEDTAFCAVFDGHGGQMTAKFCAIYLHGNIVNSEEFSKGDCENAIIQGYLKTDQDLKADPEYEKDHSGCTAVCALVTKDNMLHVGNAGDSRAVLCKSGRAIPLSFDHKPSLESESSRIYEAGGRVEFGRVNGNLALSRAIGDFEFKQNHDLPPEKQIVTAFPDVIANELCPKDEFIVLACDGIWDCMSNQDVVNFIRNRISAGVELPNICEQLMDNCLATESGCYGIGCDNMTVVIIGFLNGMSEKEWQESIANRASSVENIPFIPNTSIIADS